MSVLSVNTQKEGIGKETAPQFSFKEYTDSYIMSEAQRHRLEIFKKITGAYLESSVFSLRADDPSWREGIIEIQKHELELYSLVVDLFGIYTRSYWTVVDLLIANVSHIESIATSSVIYAATFSYETQQHAGAYAHVVNGAFCNALPAYNRIGNPSHTLSYHSSYKNKKLTVKIVAHCVPEHKHF